MDFKMLYDFISKNEVIANKPIVGDIIKGLNKTVKGSDANVFRRFGSGNNSIKFQSRKSIAQYPVLVSDSLSFKTIQIVNGALEAQYASMLALVLQNSSSEDATSAEEVINKYHTDMTHNPKLDDVFGESANKYFLCGVDSISALREANKELLTPCDKLLNESTLNSISYTRDFTNILAEAKHNNHNRNKHNRNNNHNRQNTHTHKDKDDKRKEDLDNREKALKDREKALSAKAEKGVGTRVHLTDTDVKKANDMTPTILSMKINFRNGDQLIEKEVSLGVKCVSHLILADDIEYYLTRTAFKNSPIVRVIQWTTGEISFFKDLLFSVDDLKRGAIKSNSKNGYWWRKLETMSKIAKSNKMLGTDRPGKNGVPGYKQPIPVTTMVISKEDVDHIKFRHGFNLLENPKMIQKIINNFYLMNFLIIDEGTDTYYMFNEDTKVLERYPKSAFQKMSSKDKFDVEELYKMLK